MDYKNKYIKYKTKYLELKDIDVHNQIGGGNNTNDSNFNEIVNFIKKSTKEKRITDSITTNNSDDEYYDVTIISDDDTLKTVSYLNIIKLIKERLCDDDWKIFELHFLQGYNQAETGNILKLREDTMWFRIKRIRKKLDGIQNL